MTKITLTRMCELAAQHGAREANGRIAELEARAYKLAVAIMGGEDAPGYADSIDADVLADQLREERMRHQEWTDACVSSALARITVLERALDEIIMEATSRNHAIDIARRARAEGGE